MLCVLLEIANLLHSLERNINDAVVVRYLHLVFFFFYSSNLLFQLQKGLMAPIRMHAVNGEIYERCMRRLLFTLIEQKICTSPKQNVLFICFRLVGLLACDEIHVECLLFFVF